MTDTIHAALSPAAATADGIHPFGPGEKGPCLARYYGALWRFERQGLSTREPRTAQQQEGADRRRELDEAEAAARAAGADDADIEDIRTEIGDALLDATWT